MQTESHHFDLEPRTPEKPRHRGSWITMAAFGAVAVVLALIGLDVVLINGAQAPPPRPIVQVVKETGSDVVTPVVYASVTPGIKPGPGGKLYDAYSVTNFTVRAGQPVKLVINNTDDVPHSITSPDAGVNIVVKPGTHSYTLLVHKAGHFLWYCSQPCDPYSMSHVGYMRGYITSETA